MRKLALSLFTMFVMAGLVIAASGTVTEVKDKKVTIKTKDGEKTYNVTDDTKFSTTDFKGENEKKSDLEALTKAASRKGKGGKAAGAKVEFEAKGEDLTEVKWKAGGKKKKE